MARSGRWPSPACGGAHQGVAGSWGGWVLLIARVAAFYR
jgi:hypothetical protein